MLNITKRLKKTIAIIIVMITLIATIQPTVLGANQIISRKW